MSEREDDELEATEAERAEAEALARALERGAARDAGPEDAVAPAALLRAAARPAPDAARLEAAAARGRAALGARRPSRLRWLFPIVLAPSAAAAAVALFFVSSARHAPVPPLPQPSAALLEAQARAARGRPDLTALDAQMRDYRAAYYAALAEERR